MTSQEGPLPDEGPDPDSDPGSGPRPGPVHGEVSALGDVFTGQNAVQSGRYNTQNNYYGPARPPVAWPLRIGVLPRRADSFQDRLVARELDDAAPGATTALTRVLTGTGGVGKTQLAAQYARRAWENKRLDLLVWINAATRTEIIAGYARAASMVLGFDTEDPKNAADAFLSWLAPRPGRRSAGRRGAGNGTDPYSRAGRRRWLIVLDDVADPAVLRGLWPPDNPYGHTIVTTRCRDAAMTGAGRRLVPVGLFTPPEATSCLTAFLTGHNRHEPAAEIAALAEELGYLPLALSQAAAYLIDADLDCASYRARLADRANVLADVLPDAAGLPDDQPTSVAAAWSLSIDHADQRHPLGLARPMLQLVAMLDSAAIPAAALESAPAIAYLTEERPARQPAAPERPADRRPRRSGTTARDAVGALRTLHLLSLIEHTPGSATHTVRVHQLVQRALRDALDEDQLVRLVRAAADALTAVWPEDERDAALVQVLRANTISLIRSGGAALLLPDVHPLLVRAGRSLSDTGQITAAVRHFERLRTDTLNLLGPSHPATLTARHALAMQYGLRGSVDLTISELRDLLADRHQVLGPDHPDTLETRHDLIWWQWEAGDLHAALLGLPAVLTDRLRVLGPDHPDTLETRHNLFHAWACDGQVRRAVDGYRELLADRKRIQGPDHPHTLGARHQLAAYRAVAGDRRDAVRDLTELVQDRERLQGADHPDTLATRKALGRFQGEAGDATGALATLGRLLDDQNRVLGPDHPDTLATRQSLARWQAATGNPQLALATLTTLLHDRQRVLGPANPHTLQTRYHLAHQQHDTGRHSTALATLTALLADQQHILGPDHHDTQATRDDLARWQSHLPA